jgi:hypothetical protein
VDFTKVNPKSAPYLATARQRGCRLDFTKVAALENLELAAD